MSEGASTLAVPKNTLAHKPVWSVKLSHSDDPTSAAPPRVVCAAVFGTRIMVFTFLSTKLPPALFLIYLCAASVSGVFIGAVGIGGVLLVPLLLLLDVPVGVASRAVLASFFLVAAVAAITNARRGSLPRRPAMLILGCAAPGALVGSWILPHVPSLLRSCALAMLALVSGLITVRDGLHLRRSAAKDRRSHGVEPAADGGRGTESDSDASGLLPTPHQAGPDDGWTYALIGLVVGVGSVLTATGGPFVCVPLLLWLTPRLPTTHVVGLSTSAGLPISLCSTLLNGVYSDVDLGLAMGIAVAVAAGIPLGVRLAHHTQRMLLQGSKPDSDG